MPIVSVIVPVYNAEKYLHRCIDSILKQTFTDFELLLIDDGSKDESGKLCDEYALNNSNVFVFHKENSGVASARNYGLDKACGKWITFIDSDDWVDDEYLYSLLQGRDTQMSVCSYLVEGSDEKWYCDIPDVRLSNMKSVETWLFEYFKYKLRAPWGILYSREIIESNSLRYDITMTIGEDLLFNLKYIAHISSLYSSSAKLYHYFKGNAEALTASGVSHDKYNYIRKSLIIKCYKALIDNKWMLEKTRERIFFDVCYFDYQNIRDMILGENNTILEKRKRLKDSFDNKATKYLLKIDNPKNGKIGIFYDFLVKKGSWKLLILISRIYSSMNKHK